MSSLYLKNVISISNTTSFKLSGRVSNSLNPIARTCPYYRVDSKFWCQNFGGKNPGESLIARTNILATGFPTWREYLVPKYYEGYVFTNPIARAKVLAIWFPE